MEITETPFSAVDSGFSFTSNFLKFDLKKGLVDIFVAMIILDLHKVFL